MTHSFLWKSPMEALSECVTTGKLLYLFRDESFLLLLKQTSTNKLIEL